MIHTTSITITGRSTERRRAGGGRILRHLQLLSILLSGLLVAGLVAAASAAAQGPPMRVFGSARLGGLPAPPGTVIQAVVGATRCGSGSVGPDGRFALDVATSPMGSCAAVPGTLVGFTVGGLPAREAVAFEPGAFVALDLSALNRPELVGEFLRLEPPATGRR